VREAVTPEPSAEAERVEPPQEAAAPEAATTQVVTEATRTDENASAAPLTSPRPQARPQRPVQTAAQQTAVEQPAAQQPVAEQPQETPPAAEPPADAMADAVAAALADVFSEGAPTASGPPLTGTELDGLRAAVAQCWNVGALSSDALAVTVTVGIQLDREGRPSDGSLRMIGAQGGGNASAQQAYETARRAILRCGAQGFDLPADKYDQWRDIEMTFNPESMRIR
jgi:hypothetical protein